MTRRELLKSFAKSKKDDIQIPTSEQEINRFVSLFNYYVADLQAGLLSPHKFKKAYEYLMEITKL